MELCCDLQVDVNGEEIFMVNKAVLAAFSRRFDRLFGSLTGKLKVIFHHFPGGAESFELMAGFCYNGGEIDITPSNIVQLNYAAWFMEMDSDLNLVEQTEKSLQGIEFWSWSELLVALKQCQDINPDIDLSLVLHKVLDSVVGKIVCPSFATQYTSSSDNSCSQFSCETRSSNSTKDSQCQSTNWWFDDVLFLNMKLVEIFVNRMVYKKVDHFTVSKFIFYYQKCNFFSIPQAEKQGMMETVINLFSLLNISSVSFKLLFDIFRVSSSLKISKVCRNKLECLMGSKLDQASVDYLLVPSPNGKDYMYDVNLVLRLVRAFILISPSQLNKVSGFGGSYLIEVAPDINLKPSKFAALVSVLPDSARDSHYQLYRAMDLYLEVHARLCQYDKTRVCCSLNYEKLSPEVLKHLKGNSKFASKSSVKDACTKQSRGCKEWPILIEAEENKAKQIIVHEKKIDKSSNTDIIRQYQGLHSKVMELEKKCRMKKIQMVNSKKGRLVSQANSRSLPKLCMC